MGIEDFEAGNRKLKERAEAKKRLAEAQLALKEAEGKNYSKEKTAKLKKAVRVARAELDNF